MVGWRIGMGARFIGGASGAGRMEKRILFIQKDGADARPEMFPLKRAGLYGPEHPAQATL